MKKLLTMFALALLALAVAPACSSSNTNAPADEAVAEQPEAAPAEAAEAEPAEPATTAATAAGDVLPNDGTRKIGDVTTCAVSGDVFTITDSTPKAEYEGGTYYFCCEGCVDRFQADPAKYTQAAAAPAEEAAEEAAEDETL